MSIVHDDITIKVSTSNIAGLLAVAKMFNELAGAVAAEGDDTAIEALRNADQPETPVVSAQDAFQTPVPPATPANVIPFVPPAGSPAATAAAAVPPAAPAVPPAAPSGELDSACMPYDLRIHAKTKTKCKDGTWKKAKGADPALVAAVETELRNAMTAPVIPAVTVAPPATIPASATGTIPVTPSYPPASDDDGFPDPPAGSIPAAVPPAPPAAVPPAPPAAVAPVAPVAPVQPAPVATVAPATFAELMAVVTAMQTTNKISFPEVMAVCQQHGLANLALLAGRVDMIPQVYASLEAVWTGR